MHLICLCAQHSQTIIMMGGDSMLENANIHCPEILICTNNPYTNDGFMMDRMRVNIDILKMLNITKYIHVVRYGNDVWLSISRIYWNDVIIRCNETIIDACRMVVSIYDSDDENTEARSDLEAIHVIINMIRIVSDIAHKLQYILDNFDDEDSPLMFIDMEESDRLKIGIDIRREYK